MESGQKDLQGEFPLRTWEKLVRLIPGLAGYQGKERIREADRLCRTALAERLGLLQHKVEGIKKALTEEKDWRLLPALDLLTRKMARARDMISFSRYGYAGVFDLQKIGRKELEEIYRFDLELALSLEDLRQAVDGFCLRAGQGSLEAEEIRLLGQALEDFTARLSARPGTEGVGGG